MRRFSMIALGIFLYCGQEPEPLVEYRTLEAPKPIESDRLVQAPDDSPLQIGGDVLAPVPISRVEPTLPSRLTSAGPLILKAIIDKHGNVREVQVIRDGTSPSVGEAYVNALKQWKFRPATRGGEPVSVEYPVTVNINVR